MNKTQDPQTPGQAVRKDSVACAVVLASMLLTVACGVFVIDAGPDSNPQYAQASEETVHD